MRYPVARVNSHYAHRLLKGRIKQPPDIEIKQNAIYLDRSRSAVQLAAYQKHFSDQQFLLLIFEELISHPDLELRKVADFLGVLPDYFVNSPLASKNVSMEQKVLNKKAKVILQLPITKKFVRLFPSWTKRMGKSIFILD